MQSEQMKVSLRDLKFLLECEERAQISTKLGYAGAIRTAKEIITSLNVKVEVPTEAVEAALFSYAELKNKGYAVEHPDGLSKDALAKRLTPPGQTYDKELGVFHRKERN
jgi:hypothetical protein